MGLLSIIEDEVYEGVALQPFDGHWGVFPDQGAFADIFFQGFVVEMLDILREEDDALGGDAIPEPLFVDDGIVVEVRGQAGEEGGVFLQGEVFEGFVTFIGGVEIEGTHRDSLQWDGGFSLLFPGRPGTFFRVKH
jgi:hypothetical protein